MEPESKERLQLKYEDLSHAAADAVDLWSDDCLGRKETAENLESIVLSQNGPIVIALNGKWGSGKTFFLDRFAKQYRGNKRTSVFFDAWQDDTLEDPLLAMIGQLSQAFTSERLKKEFKAILSSVFRFLKTTATNVCKAQTGFDPEALLNPPDTFFDLYQEGLKAREELRKSLTHLAQKNFEETKAPLLFVIDELDRCRPTFAVSLLERVKHLLSIPHVVFVIGADLEQLKHTIRSVYGNIDVSNYLHRFLDVELMLPEVPRDAFINMLCRRRQFAKHQPGNDWCEMMKLIADCQQLSLREVEKCCRLSAFVSFAQDASEIDIPWLVVPAVVLKVRDERKYQKFLRWDVTPRELVELVYPHLTYHRFQMNARYLRDITRLLRYCALDPQSSYLNELKAICSRMQVDRHSTAVPAFLESASNQEVLSLLQAVKDSANGCASYDPRLILQKIAKRLDFIGPENF